jgi:hypothetical protein
VTTYCANDPCETEAVRVVIHPNGDRTPLCFTCAQAYEWGQASPDAVVADIDQAKASHDVVWHCPKCAAENVDSPDATSVPLCVACGAEFEWDDMPEYRDEYPD